MNALRTLPICLYGLLMIASLARADEKPGFVFKTGFLDRVHKDAEGKESKYVLFVPKDYDGKKAFPTMLFLHGAGERGADGQKQAAVGIGKAIKNAQKEDKEKANDFPFLVVMPQAEKTWQADSPDGKRALAILDEVEKDYKVDKKRVYLTGLSMGGSGTWSLAAAYPNRWAAIVPLCGGGDPKAAEKVKDIPCWCFVGDADRAETVKNNRDMIDALKGAGGKPKFDVYEKVGHNCWDKAYATKELYEWLLKQELK
jgi:predicted peptidase